MAVDEFPAVVTVQTQPCKGLRLFDIAQLLDGPVLASAIHSPHLHPGRTDVSIVHDPDVLASHSPPAERHRVGFGPARFVLLPGTAPDRNALPQHRSRPGARTAFALRH